ncbi:DUF6807 family protein [Acidobacteriota bacterium]
MGTLNRLCRSKDRHFLLCGILCVVFILSLSSCSRTGKPVIEFDQDDEVGLLSVRIDGREALVFQYGVSFDMPHYWPLNSPSGRNMLVQKIEPYPHHRSFWFADTISLEGGRHVSTYNSLYTGQETGENTFEAPFNDFIRHRSIQITQTEEDKAIVETRAVWLMEGDQPVLDEIRQLTIAALGNGEYFMDITFNLKASYGDVQFVSDDVHYAWPYLRLNTPFSGENGGIITSSTGSTGQEATNMKVALWIDYSNSLDGDTEGVAVFQWPDGLDHRWLTREYGCFGPRRPDDRSGNPFELKKGESLTQRVGIFVHSGDVSSGRIADRYQEYIKDRLF